MLSFARPLVKRTLWALGEPYAEGTVGQVFTLSGERAALPTAAPAASDQNETAEPER